MIRLLSCLPFLLPALAASPPDVLRLSDGSLEGHFAGISSTGELRWQREDAAAPLKFKLDRVQHIALRGAQPLAPNEELSHIFLSNGDCIPGQIREMDGQVLILDSPVAGTLEIPLHALRSLAPNPFGGRLIYAGPYESEGWETILPSSVEPPTEPTEPTWRHSGGYWYYTGGQEVLRRPMAMPRLSVLRLHLDWRNRAPLMLALQADFSPPPEPAEGAEEAPRQDYLTEAFGNALVLSLRNNYVTLQRCGFDAQGQSFSRMIQTNAATIDFARPDEADLEVRTDLDQGTVTLYADGAYMLHWQLSEEDRDLPGPGGLGFAVPGNRDSMRISNLLVAEWNGMPDAARSFLHPSRDQVLLTNGTDRFSGDITGIREGVLSLSGPYAELTVPLAEIAEIHFAGESSGEATSTLGDGSMKCFFQPIGRITGKILDADGEHARLSHPMLGELQIDLTAASLLEYQPDGQFLSPWDE